MVVASCVGGEAEEELSVGDVAAVGFAVVGVVVVVVVGGVRKVPWQRKPGIERGGFHLFAVAAAFPPPECRISSTFSVSCLRPAAYESREILEEIILG